MMLFVPDIVIDAPRGGRVERKLYRIVGADLTHGLRRRRCSSEHQYSQEVYELCEGGIYELVTTCFDANGHCCYEEVRYLHYKQDGLCRISEDELSEELENMKNAARVLEHSSGVQSEETPT